MGHRDLRKTRTEESKDSYTERPSSHKMLCLVAGKRVPSCFNNLSRDKSPLLFRTCLPGAHLEPWRKFFLLSSHCLPPRATTVQAFCFERVVEHGCSLKSNIQKKACPVVPQHWNWGLCLSRGAGPGLWHFRPQVQADSSAFLAHPLFREAPMPSPKHCMVSSVGVSHTQMLPGCAVP